MVNDNNQPIQKDDYTDKSVILVSRSKGDPLPVKLEDGKTIVGDSTTNSGIAQVEVGVDGGGGGGATDFFVKTSGVLPSSVAAGVQADGDFTGATVVGDNIAGTLNTFTLQPGLYTVQFNVVFYKGASAEDIKVRCDLGLNAWDQGTIVEWVTIPPTEVGNEGALRFHTIAFSQNVNAVAGGTGAIVFANNSATESVSIDGSNVRITRLGDALEA